MKARFTILGPAGVSAAGRQVPGAAPHTDLGIPEADKTRAFLAELDQLVDEPLG